jgi:hypothetical protein
MGLDDLAARLDAASAELAGAGHLLESAGPVAGGLGVDARGAPGALGRVLYRSWSAAVAARQREASAHAVRLADAAASVRAAAGDYREADLAGADRLRDLEG